MIRESTEELDREVEERIRVLQRDPDLARRFDVTGDGIVDEREWELVRRMIRLELLTRRAAHDTKLPGSFQVGDRIADRFELLGVLGRGGQGITYLAEDLEGGGHVVVKQLLLRAAEHWKAIELFQREAEVLESINHPRIPRYIDAFAEETGDSVGFVLIQQYVFGRDLETYLATQRWNADDAWEALEELASILAYLHSLSPPVIHRDIKPSNIVVAEHTGKLHLVDFGAAQNVVSETVGGSTVVGTSGYVPMEQYMGKATPASDIYGLGATIVHCVTGVAPIDLTIRRGRLQYEKHIGDSRLKTILKEMLEPFPEERIRNGAELLSRLSDVEPADGEAAGTTESPEPTDRKSRSLIPRRYEDISRRWLTVTADPDEGKLVREFSEKLVLTTKRNQLNARISTVDPTLHTATHRAGNALAVLIVGFGLIAGGVGPVAGVLTGAALFIALWFFRESRWIHLRMNDRVIEIPRRSLDIDSVRRITITNDTIGLHHAEGRVAQVGLPRLDTAEQRYLEKVLNDALRRLKTGEGLNPDDIW